MKYYDIHTHHQPVHPEDLAVIQLDPIPKELAFRLEAAPPACNQHAFSCGIHPSSVRCLESQLKQLEECLPFREVVALGEAGFDKYIPTPVALQQEAFLAQADLAEQFLKPVIIHCVKAWPEIVGAKNSLKPRSPWIIHGFRGNGILASQLIRHRFYLSFGYFFNPDAVRLAWPERLCIETDDCRVDIRSVYTKIAAALFIDESSLVRQVADNLVRLGLIE